MRDVTAVLHDIERGRTSAGATESEWLDFKTDKPTSRETCADLADAAVCFANASGGTIVLGVADRGTGPDSFVGTSLTPADVRGRIHALTSPPLLVDVQGAIRMGRSVLLITVPEGLEVYSTSKGVHLRRLNDTCLPMRPAEVALLAEERSGRDWSAGRSERTVREVDAGAETALYSLLRSTARPTQERIGRLDLAEVVQQLSLTSEGGNLSRAAELLLCPPVDGVREVLVYQHRKTRSGEADFVRRWRPPLLTAFLECMDVVSARVTSAPSTSSQGQQLLVEDYPLVAIREALINALVHGDLRDGSPVQIEHSPERLVVASPGPLVTGITPSNILTHGSRPRFPRLAKTMTTLGLAEELGQGVDRMYREMIRSGRSTPLLSVRGDAVPATVVEFDGGPANLRLAKFVADLPEAERSDTDALLVLLALCTRRTVNAKVVAELIQRDAPQAQEVLQRLAHGEAELVEPTPGTLTRTYPNFRLRGSALAVLGHAVTYNRRSVAETDRKVIDHLRDYETINNSTLQRLFDIDVYQARDLLRDLVGREILTRVSTQTRGTAVKYGPGPRFPVVRHRKGRR
ncbi:MAG: RNA-binding domain-containing protein [Dermatophilaceae bacterium]